MEERKNIAMHTIEIREDCISIGKIIDLVRK